MANSTVQTLPIAERLNASQQARRQRRITARATVAEALTQHAVETRWMVIQGLQAVRVLRNIVLGLAVLVAIMLGYLVASAF